MPHQLAEDVDRTQIRQQTWALVEDARQACICAVQWVDTLHGDDLDAALAAVQQLRADTQHLASQLTPRTVRNVKPAEKPAADAEVPAIYG